jgi:hypothetical protein
MISSLNMSKMATLFEDKKTAKTSQLIYFTAKTNEPSQPKTKLKILTKKVYKKREENTGGERRPRNDRRPFTLTNPFEFRGHHHLALERATSSVIRSYKDPSTGVSNRGNLYGRHAVSVPEKTRQKVNVAQPRLKVSNPTKTRGVSGPGRCASTL